MTRAESIEPTATSDMEQPGPSTPADLLDWKPQGEVVSVYVRVEPGDRSGRWRLELRDDLDRALLSSAAEDEESSRAMAATHSRIEATVASMVRNAAGQGIIGFVEVTRSPSGDHWYATQLPPRRTQAHLAAHPRLAPMLELLEDGTPTGVAVVSGECVRIFDWRLGLLEQLSDWDLEVFSLDWREGKTPVSRDTSVPSGVSPSGHDRYENRLGSNRERFADQAGRRAKAQAREREWVQLLVFGDPRYATPFTRGFGDGCSVAHVESADLVAQPTHKIAERVDRLLPEINRKRQCELVERVKESGFAGDRAAFGPQETQQSLQEGRVEQVIYDARLEAGTIEPIIELAGASGAALVPVEGAAAAALSEQGGVVALLRY